MSILDPQNPIFCSPNASVCYSGLARHADGCSVSCTGLYADVDFYEAEGQQMWVDFTLLADLQEDYMAYKRNFAKNIVFNQDITSLGKTNNYDVKGFSMYFCLDEEIEYSQMQLLQIYFDTATYDEIERDVKVTLEAQLGLIGGTMGLLTGFSILSGVEIIYYAIKLFMSLRS